MDVITIEEFGKKVCGNKKFNYVRIKLRDGECDLWHCQDCQKIHSAPAQEPIAAPENCDAMIVYQLRWTPDLSDGKPWFVNKQLTGVCEKGWFLRDYPYTCVKLEHSEKIEWAAWKNIKLLSF